MEVSEACLKHLKTNSFGFVLMATDDCLLNMGN